MPQRAVGWTRAAGAQEALNLASIRSLFHQLASLSSKEQNKPFPGNCLEHQIRERPEEKEKNVTSSSSADFCCDPTENWAYSCVLPDHNKRNSVFPSAVVLPDNGQRFWREQHGRSILREGGPNHWTDSIRASLSTTLCFKLTETQSCLLLNE